MRFFIAAMADLFFPDTEEKSYISGKLIKDKSCVLLK
jgi:hypothetical protein